MKRLITLLIVLLFWAGSSWAQVSAYTFASSTGTYTALSTETVLYSGTFDDQCSSAITIPSFTADGTAYTTMFVQANGWISLGGTSISSSYYPISQTTSYPVVISAFGRDLNNAAAGTPKISYNTNDGGEIVVQYQDVRRYSVAGERLSFQIRLNPSTGNIKFVYGGTITGGTNSYYPEVGLRGATNTIYNNRTTTTNWAATTAGGSNSATCLTSTTVTPSVGLTFTFTPPVIITPPNCATIVSPANTATNVLASATLNWGSGGGAPTGYKLYFGTNNPPTNIVDGTVLGNVTTYDPSPDMSYSTPYYWKIVAYNANGDATGCSVWSFTTMADPTVTVFPYQEGFENAWVGTPSAPLGWSQITVSGTNVWNRSTTSPHTGTYCALAPYASVGGEHLLITPPLDLTTINYRLKFWLKGSSSTGTDLKIQIATSNSSASNFTTDLAYYIAGTNMPTVWTEKTIDLSAYENIQFIAFRMIDDDGYNLYIDDVTIEEIPSTPIFSISPTSKPFGQAVAGGTPTVAQTFTISNIGGDTLTITSGGISLTGTDPGQFTLVDANSYPINLTSGTATLTVAFAPTSAGSKSANLQVVHNAAGSPSTVPLTGTGLPAGSLFESFEGTTFPPPAWSVDASSWTQYTYTAYEGTNSAYIYTYTAISDKKLITPKVTIATGDRLDYYAETGSGTNQIIQVRYSPDKINWSNIGSPVTLTSTFTQYSVDLTILAGNNYYLAFAATTTSSYVSFYIDYVIGPIITQEVPGPATIGAPANTATDVLVSTTLSWSAGSTGGIPTGYNLYFGTDGGGTTPPTSIENGTERTSPYTPASALAYNTTYYWQVVPFNGLGSATGCPIWSFETQEDPTITPPFTQDFEGTFLPSNWMKYMGLLTTSSTLTTTTSGWIQDDWRNVTSPVNKAAGVNIYGSSVIYWLITPPIDLGDGTTDYELRFDLSLTDYGNSDPITSDPNGTTGTDDKFAVVISTDNGATWSSTNTLRLWDNAGSSYVYNNISNTGETIILDLSANSGIIKIGFYGESTISNADNDLFVDNVIVQEPPLCEVPTSMAVPPATITNNSAIINWTEPSPAPANGYQIYWSSSSAAPDEFTTPSATVASGNTSYIMTPLTSNATYYAWMRSDCGSSQFSVWSAPQTFTTQLVVSLPYEEGFLTTTTPTGWIITGWTIGSTRGVTGNPGNNIYKNLYSSVATGTFTTVNIGTVSSGSWLSFDYKLANYNSPYSPPENGSGNYVISLSIDYGANYTALETIANNGVVGWQNKLYDLTSYVGENIKIKIIGNWISGDYDLAFDNFEVYSLTNMAYTSSTTTQANTSDVARGTINAQIIGIEVVTTGSLSPLSITSFEMNTNGTTNNPDITATRLYYTGTSNSFATSSQFGSQVDSPSGTFNFAGTQELSEGTNYFWLVYDIASGAADENLVDAECVSVVVDGSTYTPTVTNPAGNRTIREPLSGAKTVGTGGDYETLTGPGGLFETLNNLGLSGNLTVTITGNTTEDGTNALNQWAEEGTGGYSVTISPKGHTLDTVTGTYASGALIRLNGASRVTIDGSNNGSTGRDMTISNTSVTEPFVILIGSVGTSPVDNITLKNCNIINGSNASASAAVIVSDAGTLYGDGYFNNITIQNNSIQKARYGIDIAGAAAHTGANVVVQNNVMTATGADQIGGGGIWLFGVDGALIHNNSISNFETITDESDYGIWLDVGSKNVTVSNNTISTLAYAGTNAYTPVGIIISANVLNSNIDITGNTISGITTTGSGSSVTTSGILVANATGGINIIKNKINDIKNTNDFGWGCNGIQLNSSSTNANVLVANNLIYDVAAYGYTQGGVADNGYGIILVSGGGYKLYYNSISMNTSQSQNGYPAAINITSGITTANSLDIRNNIFSNTQTVGTERYAIYCGASNTVFTNINNNDYYTTGANLGYLGSSRLDLAAWKIATGQDVKSISADPIFTDGVLHLNPATSPAIGKATPLTLVTTDYAGITRHIFKPTMGAYEYPPLNFYMWTGLAGTNWNTAGNWSPAAVPGLNDDVGIPSVPAGGLIFPIVPVSGSPFNVDELYLGPGAAVNIPNGATLNVNNTNP